MPNRYIDDVLDNEIKKIRLLINERLPDGERISFREASQIVARIRTKPHWIIITMRGRKRKQKIDTILTSELGFPVKKKKKKTPASVLPEY